MLLIVLNTVNVGIYLKIGIVKGMLSYSWVNMVCANCMMSHTPAVNGKVNSYRNVPDNVNYVWLAHFTT